MKYLSIVKGNDYALSLVHYIRHGRKFDCIICLDEDSDKVLTDFGIEHRLLDEIFNVYISKVVYTLRYQREVNDIVCYSDVFVNFDDYEGLEDFMQNNYFEGLLVPNREMYWPGVEKGYLPICKCMFAYKIPEEAEKEYLEKLTTTEDSQLKDFQYSYYNSSYGPWYSRNLNGYADDEVTLEFCKDLSWYSKENWMFWDIQKFFNKSYLEAGHDLLYFNIFCNNLNLNVDEDLYSRYSVTPETAQNYFSYKGSFEDEESCEKILVIE